MSYLPKNRVVFDPILRPDFATKRRFAKIRPDFPPDFGPTFLNPDFRVQTHPIFHPIFSKNPLKLFSPPFF